MIREKDEQRWEIAALYNHENVRPYSIGKVFEKLTLGEFSLPRRRHLLPQQRQHVGGDALAFFYVGEAGEDELVYAEFPVI